MDLQNPIEKQVLGASPEAPSWPPREEEPLRESAPVAEKEALAATGHAALEPKVESEGASASTANVEKNGIEKEIENILEEDLDQLFWNLSPTDQTVFKQRGEETAGRIRSLLGEATLRVQEIFQLILDWLKTLPGVDTFFAEKEAKIKTDKIIRFRK